jgi:hypothetical protein
MISVSNTAISMKARTGSHNPYNPYGYGEFSFLDNPSLRRQMAAALEDRGVSISLAEGFVAVPGADLIDDRASLDVMWELGASRANVVEFSKSLALSDLDTALEGAGCAHRGRVEAGETGQKRT